MLYRLRLLTRDPKIVRAWASTISREIRDDNGATRRRWNNRTGALRQSIRSHYDGRAVGIRMLFYGSILELGSATIAARRFVRRAFSSSTAKARLIRSIETQV